MRYRTNVEELEKLEKEADAAKGARAGFYKAHSGKNLIRICPPREGARWLRPVGKHKIGSGMGEGNSITCPKVTYGTACPICAMATRIAKTKGAEAAEAFLPITRYYVAVIDLKSAESKIQIWDASMNLIRPLLSWIRDLDDDTVLDLRAGNNYEFKKTGEAKKTRYTDTRVLPKATNLEDLGHDVDELMANLPDLEKAPWKSSDEEVQDFCAKLAAKVRDGSNGDEDEDDDGEVARPVAKKKAFVSEDEEDDLPSAPPVKKKVQAAVEQEDEDDDAPIPAKKVAARAAVEEDEEEDEAPAPVKKAKPKPVAVEEDPEEEEEAPKPVAKPKPKVKPVVEEDPEEETEDEEEAPPPPKKPVAKPKPQPVEEEQDDAPPPKKPVKKKPVVEEDEDEDFPDSDAPF